MKGFRIAARGLIVDEDRLLFVSDDEHYWYLPGGRVESDESLTECVEREVFEETGLIVKAQKLLHVLECFDINDRLHKINFYFQTTLVNGSVSEHWNDVGGNVQFRRFFSLTDIQNNPAILPRFLSNGSWSHRSSGLNNVYQGTVTMRGFETVEICA